MHDTPRGPENSPAPAQEKFRSFSLTKLMERLNELAPSDFEHLESLIGDGKLESAGAEKIRKAVEALQGMKASEDKISALKEYAPILVDLIHARDIVDDLIENKGVDPKLGSAIYNLVDAAYEVAQEDVRALAIEAVKK